ncbi:acetoacetyl-CoA synthetase [Trichonephila clavipes]|nr:acetoacetyl-CoA synthetase [Trichonephila clavipes]
MPVIRRIGEPTIPYSWRACEQLRHFMGCVIVRDGLRIASFVDDTVKQRGTRFGSSEIYNVVDLFYEVHDCVCVSHYNKDMEGRAVLFLKIRDGHIFNDDLVQKIQKAIAKELTSFHVPDIILQTRDILYNMNGKKMESVVKNIINKRPYNSDSVVNPECLSSFCDIPELKDF